MGYNKEQIYEKLKVIFKSPIDADYMINEYSRDLLDHCIRQYDIWRERNQGKDHSVNYFKKILETSFNAHRSKKAEVATKREDDGKAFQNQIAKNEKMHLDIDQNIGIKSFLVQTLANMPANETYVVRHRARNHLCYSKNADLLDAELREKLKKGEKSDIVVEDINKKFDKLEEMCMLVEIRSQLISGHYWNYTGKAETKEEIRKLIEV